MKKLLAAIAVASLALTACGSSQTDPNDDDTLTGKPKIRHLLRFH